MSKVEMIEAKYVLNADEKRQLADEISQTIAEINGLRAEKQAETQRLGTEIKRAEGVVQAKSETYRLGYDYRDQPATLERDYEAGLFRWYHAETGVLLKEKPMSYEERQREFDFNRRAEA